MNLDYIGNELERAFDALSNEEYGSEQTDKVIAQAKVLADIYKTVSSADTDATRVNDEHEKAINEQKFREKDAETKKIIDDERNRLERDKLEIEKDKLKLDAEKYQASIKTDESRTQLERERLELDSRKCAAERTEAIESRKLRNRELIFGVSKDTLITIAQIGAGVLTFAGSIAFGQDVLKFEQTGVPCSFVAKSIFPAILGRRK